MPSVYENGQKQREFNKMEKQLAKGSQYVGKLHDRGEFDLTVIHKKFIWRSNSYLYVTQEGDSNIVKFFSSDDTGKVGDKVSVAGYVKDWSKGKYSGGDETYLNRVKFNSSAK